MKKTFVRALALTLVAVMLVTMLVSCGGIKAGEYKSAELLGSYTKYTFKGNNYTLESYIANNKVDSATVEGTYKVDGDEIIFTWEDSEGNEKTDTVAFAENDDGSIKIAGITFTPVEK